MDDFLIRALIAGVMVAITTGVLGCFVVWRKMAYFGDSLSHSALLGVALGLALGIHTTISVMLVGGVFAVALVWLQYKKLLATDTLLGILAHSALAIGMVTLSIFDIRVDIHSYLFGDILTVTNADIYLIYAVCSMVLLVIMLYWQRWVLMTIHEDIAAAEGENILKLHILLVLVMMVTVAVSIKVAGMLLVTSMLIIPAATARLWGKTPQHMGMLSALLGSLAVGFGMSGAWQFDAPSGPSIVVASVMLFMISVMVQLFRRMK